MSSQSASEDKWEMTGSGLLKCAGNRETNVTGVWVSLFWGHKSVLKQKLERQALNSSQAVLATLNE